jgi:Na+-driven multidrug efflux pump
MLLSTIFVIVFPESLIRVFSRDPQVVAVGGEYLQLVALNFVASGIIFVSSSMFQALGNTVPPMLSSFLRVILLAVPVILLSRVAGFHLRWVWYLSVASVWTQMLANVILLRREFTRKLNFAPPPASAQPVAAN